MDWNCRLLLSVVLVPTIACATGPTARVDEGTPGELLCSFADDPTGRRFELRLENGTESPVTGIAIGEYDEAGNVVGVEVVEGFVASPTSPWPRGTYTGTWRGQSVALSIDGTSAGLFKGQAALAGAEPAAIRCDFDEYTVTE